MDDVTIKKTIALLRQAQGDEPAMRDVLLNFVRESLNAGMTLEQAISMLALGPDSVASRALFTEEEHQRVIQILQNCSLGELL